MQRSRGGPGGRLGVSPAPVPDDRDRRSGPVPAPRLLRRARLGDRDGYPIGAVLSAAAGFIGIDVAVRSNSRTSEAATHGSTALTSRSSGSVTGLLVVGLGLRVAGYYWALTDSLGPLLRVRDRGPHRARLRRLLISVFARLGGGTTRRRPTSGRTSSGRIEAGIPENDPRNRP